MSTFVDTFLASVKSVGTACTMAMVGVYLHQRGFIDSAGKRALALISQQVTFPLFLFTKIIHCNQDWSPEPCPDVTATLQHGWMLLLWPIYVVMAGLLVGQLMARFAQTPMVQRKSVCAAVAFGNSTGLPITLLTVVHSNFPTTSDLGRVDPTLFLSVYLLLYPVLQWGMGGWLLAPEDKVKEDPKEIISPKYETKELLSDVEAPEEHHYYEAIRDSFAKNVLNGPKAFAYFDNHRLTSSDEGIYLSEVNLATALGLNEGSTGSCSSSVSESIGLDIGQEEEDSEDKPLLAHKHSLALSNQPAAISDVSSAKVVNVEEPKKSRSCYESDFIKTVKNISDRCLQPPVIGALLGMIVAINHTLRGLLVDLIDRGSHAPLEWIFDGLYSVGQAAVPINMLILGCNLSNSFNQYTGKTDKATKEGLFSNRTLMGITVGKMVVMPLVGILSAVSLRLFVLDVPPDIAASFYLVLMIVFLTVRLDHARFMSNPFSTSRLLTLTFRATQPTANNVMVMVELSGCNTKEGIASVIALQYAAAPILLSVTMAAAIGRMLDRNCCVVVVVVGVGGTCVRGAHSRVTFRPTGGQTLFHVEASESFLTFVFSPSLK
eukprot:scaffold10016_cov170-Amphora_coffeaeformis.AAC.4